MLLPPRAVKRGSPLYGSSVTPVMIRKLGAEIFMANADLALFKRVK
jgi:hypothetical protein